MLDRVRVLIDKEWAEVFKNRLVLFTVALMPIIFTILPLSVLFLTPGSAEGDSADMPDMFAAACGQTMSTNECLQIYLVDEFLLLYMMMPLAIPIAIAAYSIVGEKTTRSLEPLLATPITTEELLLGKGLAAVLPAVILTWLCFGVFLLLAPLSGITPAVRAHIFGPTWLLAVLILGPLMAVAAVNFAIIVSSRVSDPRTAEQVSMVIIVPLMGVLFAQLAGVVILNPTFMLISIAVMLAVDIGLVYVGARLFGREAILTRWR
jgi:ABC-2 type transport system permease protein